MDKPFQVGELTQFAFPQLAQCMYVHSAGNYNNTGVHCEGTYENKCWAGGEEVSLPEGGGADCQQAVLERDGAAEPLVGLLTLQHVAHLGGVRSADIFRIMEQK